VTEVGVVRTEYSFRTIPYRNRISFQVAYSTGLNGFGFALETDHRFEASAVHVLSETLMSQLEVGRFLGFRQRFSKSRGRVRRRAPDPMGVSSGARVTPSAPRAMCRSGRRCSSRWTAENTRLFVSDVRPYGYPRFGQAGLQLRFNYDPRQDATAKQGGPLAGISSGAPWKSGVYTEVTGTAYPAMWDVTSAYANVSAVAVAHVAMPILTTPLLALRVGAEKIWGDFPYFDAAFPGRRALAARVFTTAIRW
jgi:hypothetical protein